MTAAATTNDDLPFLHGLFTDNMVLQRDISVPVWGWTEPGATVTVSIAAQTVTAVAQADGKWLARLEPMQAGGPFRMKIAGPQSVVLKNVMIGDVWICSGQSNMEMGIGAATNGAEEIARATNSMIRLYIVPEETAFSPRSNPRSHWDVCTPATAAKGYWKGFSAVGYFFGRKIQEETGVPIGMIQSAWPGRIAEAWMSESALGALPEHKAQVAAFKAEVAEHLEQGAEYNEKAMQEWWLKNDPGSVSDAWAKPDFDHSAWKTMDLPQFWEQAGLPDFDGIVWYRREVTVPASWSGRDLTLHLGPIDDRDTTWFNGVKVGGLDAWNAERDYRIPADLVWTGRNVIAIRVLDTGLGGGLWGKPEQLSLERKGEPPIPLAGPWPYCAGKHLKDSTPLPRDLTAGNPNLPAVLFNGMIAPLVPFGIKGVIWYQGESNSERSSQYRDLLTALIRDWRARFGVGDFSFLIVQLANFRDGPDEPAVSDRSVIRETQMLVSQSEPNCGLAVAIDIGNPTDIHPANKQEVGRRLALAALANVYGKKIEYSGPIYRSFEIEGNSIRLSFDHANGLAARDGELKSFVIAGRDGKFAPARATIDRNTIVVSSPTVAEPVAVRYGWADSPECNLCNAAGLPASPFRTDSPP